MLNVLTQAYITQFFDHANVSFLEAFNERAFITLVQTL